MTATRTVVVEIDLEEGPISGTLQVDHTERTVFSGWIELAALLERARDQPPPERHESSHRASGTRS